MVSYDEVKQAIKDLKHNILKYMYVDAFKRRHQLYSQLLNKIHNAISQLVNVVDVKNYQLTFGLTLEHYITSKAQQLIKPSIEFSYNDQVTNMTGLDGQTYDNPTFPQIELTSEEMNELLNQMKQLPAEYRKAMCVLAVPSDKLDKMPRSPDEEDTLYGYYYADAFTLYPYHEVNYADQFGEPIDFFYFIYGAIDPLFSNVVTIRLNKVKAESLCLGWFWDENINDFKVKICVDIKPTLEISDPDNPSNVRITSAMFVLNVFNHYDFDMKCRIDQYEAPIPSNAHTLILIGAEIHGLRSVFVAKSKPLE